MKNGRGITVLIADDTATERLILATIVRREGHRVISATDGIEAVAAFERERPDIVLLDALMPNMDGFDAARQIKVLAGEELIPIIFLTSLSDTDSLVKCLEAGGDDFLSKPYNRIILQAKIKAFYRMRTLQLTMLEQRDQIAQHNEYFLQEQIVAKQVFDNITQGSYVNPDNIRYFLSPLAVFNGDILVAAMNPAGNLMVLLGDFTGHGLPAAVGAMPLASAFYGMVEKGFSMADILVEINAKLKSILPVGLFCCATMVEINYRKNTLRAWSGGLPPAYIVKADGHLQELTSTHLPLGVLAGKEFNTDVQLLHMHNEDRFYMWSDGIHEARNERGEMFGEQRLLDILTGDLPRENLFDGILQTVKDFIGQGEKSDDLSLVELPMLAPPKSAIETAGGLSHSQSQLAEWALTFEIKPSSFASFDPLPLLLSVLMEVPGLRNHSGTLYTIISELYTNALEHGVLGLDSRLKDDPEGFNRYYQLRRERSEAITEGFIRIKLQHKTTCDGGNLYINVDDSGPGFDVTSSENLAANDYSGRGLKLVQSLCDTVTYTHTGNHVQAVYSWRMND